MKTFLNEEMKPFKELTDEQLLAIVKAKIADSCDFFRETGVWHKSDTAHLSLDAVYRTKHKQLVIPWEVVKKEYKHAAMDRTTGVAIFLEEPVRHDHVWMGFGKFNLSDAITIDIDGIDWETSLVTRQEGI